MPFVEPQYYPQPWSADEQLRELTTDEMTAGFVGGTDQKPTRQTLNRALEYATAGIIYYLTRGVPDYEAAAIYQVGSIVRGSSVPSHIFRCLAASQGVAPESDPSKFELLMMTKEALDSVYLNTKYGDAHFIKPSDGDLRYYTQPAFDALFITQSDMALTYITHDALTAGYLTKDQAASIYLTQAQMDVRYGVKGDAVDDAHLATALDAYLTKTDGEATYVYKPSADATYVDQAKAIYLPQTTATATLQPLTGEAILVSSATRTFAKNTMALDPATGNTYQSQQDANINHPLTDAAWWSRYIPPTNTPKLTAPFSRCKEFKIAGDYVVNASDIPELASVASGLMMRFELIGAGGSGAVSQGNSSGNGGGAGARFDLTLVNVLPYLFPLQIHVGDGMGVNPTSFITSTPLNEAIMWAGPGKPGTAQLPGAGGDNSNTGIVTDIASLVQSSTIRIGSDGRFGTPGLMGGNGGGDAGGAGRGHKWARDHINIGAGEVVGVWQGEAFLQGPSNSGAGDHGDVAIDMSKAVNPAPKRVYMTERYGGNSVWSDGSPITYNLPNLNPGYTYTMRFHFCDLGASQVGQRSITIKVNDVVAFDKLDLIALAGHGVVYILEYDFTPASQPTVVKIIGNGTDAFINGIETIVWQGSNTDINKMNIGAAATGGWEDESHLIDNGSATTGVTWGTDLTYALNPAPLEVYKTCRYGEFSYRWTGLMLNRYYYLRMHFSENWAGSVGQRVFNIDFNGARVYTGFDIIARAGAANRAFVSELIGKPLADGTITLTFSSGGLVNGLEFMYATFDSYRINCGQGSLLGNFQQDRFFVGGATTTTTATIDTSHTTGPGPMALYQSCRFGGGGGGTSATPAWTYTIPSFVPNQAHRVRLHFCEGWGATPGQRVFNVVVNDVTIQNIDVAQLGQNVAFVIEVMAHADQYGQFVITGTGNGFDPLICGIDIMPPENLALAANGGGGAGLAHNPSNKLINGDFSSQAQLTGWTFGGGNVVHTWQVPGELHLDNGWAWQPVTLRSGRIYRAQASIRTAGATAGMGAGIYLEDGNSLVSLISSTGGTQVNLNNTYPGVMISTPVAIDWHDLSFTFTVATDCTLRFDFSTCYGTGDGGTAVFDAASITDVTELAATKGGDGLIRMYW